MALQSIQLSQLDKWLMSAWCVLDEWSTSRRTTQSCEQGITLTLTFRTSDSSLAYAYLLVVVAWHSDNAFRPINEVILWRTGLVLGWMIAYRQVNHLGI